MKTRSAQPPERVAHLIGIMGRECGMVLTNEMADICLECADTAKHLEERITTFDRLMEALIGSKPWLPIKISQFNQDEKTTVMTTIGVILEAQI